MYSSRHVIKEAPYTVIAGHSVMTWIRWCTMIISMFSLIYSPTHAQTIENHFSHYTAKDGFPEEAVYGGITQDKTGFLWIGTGNGLVRFDGREFKVFRYDPTDSNSLRENTIADVFIDSRKRLWIVTPRWLHLYHPEGQWFEHFTDVNFSDIWMYRISSEENNQFIIPAGKNLFKFDLLHHTFSNFHENGLNLQNFTGYIDYKKDEQGIEWISGQSGLVRFDTKTNQQFVFDSLKLQHKKNNNLSFCRLMLLPDGYLLAETYDMGYVLINRKTNETKQFLVKTINPEAPVENALLDRFDISYQLNDSIILSSCAGGLTTFNWRTGNVSFIKPEKSNQEGLPEADARIYSIFRDREGIIWLGGKTLERYDYKDYDIIKITGSNTKIFYNNNNVNIKEVENFISSGRIFSFFFEFFRTKSNKFLMGNYGPLWIYDSSANQLKESNDHGNQVNFNENDSGIIWCIARRNHIKSLEKIQFVNGSPKTICKYLLPNITGGIYDMKIDHTGRALIATREKGLIIFDTASKTFSYFNTESPPPLQFSNQWARCVCEDHNGCIWVGTRKGINKIETNGKTVKQYNKSKRYGDALSDWYVYDIKEDKYNKIWFTTMEQGIGRLDPSNDSVIFFSTRQGLPTPLYKEFCIDDDDNLWVRSSAGLVNINIRTFQSKLLSEDEGFPSNFNFITLHYSRYTKKLYLLTRSSILEISKKNDINLVKVPPTAITGFLVFDKEKTIGSDNRINLNYNENFINIEFACLLFHSNKQIKYAYQLEGIDNDWVYCNDRRNAPYTNLPYGNYTFLVKAQAPDGSWSLKPTKLFINIYPPFWKTWWFYILEVLAIAGITIWIVRLYITKKLAKQRTDIEKTLAVNNERTRIASDMHDELGAGLTSLRLLSELTNLRTGKENPLKPEMIKIVQTAEGISQNLKEIIWAMNSKFDKMEDFIAYIRYYVFEYFENSLINFKFNEPRYIPDINLQGELRRNIILCIKEALNNILKHAHATEGYLSICYEAGNLIFEIKDNGVGIDITNIGKFSNGLNNMKKRLNNFGGTLEIIADNGTKLVITIPAQTLSS